MVRKLNIILFSVALAPGVAAAQQPCTSDARQVVDQVYRQILSRPVDGSGASNWASQLTDHRATVRDVIARIAKSDEFTRKFMSENPGRRDQMSYERGVDTIYRKLMNRTPTNDERTQYARIASNEGFGAVIDEILSSQQYERQYGDWRVPGVNVSYCGDRSAFNRSRGFGNDGGFGPNSGGFRDDGGFNANGAFGNANRRGFGNRDTLGTSGQLVVVNAAQQWTDTGIDVRAGDRLLFDASGSVQLSPTPDDVATPDGSKTNRMAPAAPVRNKTAGALIGRIGNGTPFFVGSQGTIDARNSGRLYLTVNDDYDGDNSGEFRVDVQIR